MLKQYCIKSLFVPLYLHHCAVSESVLVVQALRLNTLSKLTFSDSARFDALLRDLFPAVDFNEVHYEELKAALLGAYEEAQLEIIPSQVHSHLMEKTSVEL